MSDGYRLVNQTAAVVYDEPVAQPQLFTAVITAVSWPTCKIRPTNAPSGGNQLVGLCLGAMPKVNARVICAWIGGEPVVLTTIAPPAANTATRDFDFPVSILGNAWGFDQFGQNSSDTPSTTDTVNYAINFSGGLTLPDYGTFRMWVIAWQMVSHSSEAGNVRALTRINASLGNSRSANVNITTTRTPVMSRHTVGGLAGGSAVTYDAMYRPNTTGTGTAGGGDGIVVYARE